MAVAGAGTAVRPRSARAMLLPGAVALGGVLGCAFVAWWNPTRPGLPTICPLRAFLGVDCPGCGATRMVYCLLHLDFPAAVHYNAVFLAATPLVAWAFVAWTVGRWRGRPLWTWLRWSGTPYLAVAVCGVWFVIRNLPYFHALYV